MAKESLIFPKLTLILERQQEAYRSSMEFESGKLENKQKPPSFVHIPYCWEYFMTLWFPAGHNLQFIKVLCLDHNYTLFKIINLGSTLQHN